MDNRLIDLCDALRRVDEITLLEMLEIRSCDLVDKFLDEIEERLEELEGEILNGK